MIRHLNSMRWTVLFGLVLGALLSPVWQTAWSSALERYDAQFPIVTMTGRLSHQDAESVWITIQGHKLRMCTYVRMQGYTRDRIGMLSDVYTRREDVPERGETKPIGSYSIGTWRMWPKGEAAAVLMYVLHDCDGRVVLTKIAEVVL